MVKFVFILFIMSYYTTLWCQLDSPPLQKIASFYVDIAYQPINVKKNLAIAVRRLQGKWIEPNAIFSFNHLVGEGSARNGFFPGRIFSRDGVRLEPGGGLCVISSTLFNVFLRAGLDIIERHHHSKPVHYVRPGLDATIRFGVKDLKMKNPYRFPVRLRLALSDSRLTVFLLTDRPLPFRYQLLTESENDPFPPGMSEQEIIPGVSITVFRRKIDADGKIIETRHLYNDYYPPMYHR